MQEFTTEVKVHEPQKGFPYVIRMMRKMLLDDIGKANIKNLHQYFKLYAKLHGCASHNDIWESYYNFEKENINMETTELYDYKKLAQYDAESESIRLEENAPNVMHFLAYALNKHDKDELDVKDGIDRQEIDRQVLSTFFFMAVAAGYNMAQEEK